jgi:DNA-binding LacI/PurR family transcriptional regulator
VNDTIRRSATAARRRRIGVVLVRCPHALTGSYWMITASIAETLEAGGLVVRLSSGASRAEPGPAELRGAILIDAAEPSPLLQRLRGLRLPGVLLETGTAPAADAAAVWTDHGAGARSAVAHLRQLGHRRIAAIAPAAPGAARDGWLAGHVGALREAGLATPGLVRLAGGPEDGPAGQVADTLFGRDDPPTAVVCDAHLVEGVLCAARAHQLRVPQDLSVVSLNDPGGGAFGQPALTATEHASVELGHRAAIAVRQLLDGPTAPVRIAVPPTLVIRGSTGPAPGTGSG